MNIKDLQELKIGVLKFLTFRLNEGNFSYQDGIIKTLRAIEENIFFLERREESEYHE